MESQKECLGFPNQVPSLGFFNHFSITFDVRYLEYARNHGNDCCKELVSGLYHACILLVTANWS